MDDQQNNQNQNNQLPVNQEPPVYSEPLQPQSEPVPETPMEPDIETPTEPIFETPITEELPSQQSETQYEPEPLKTPETPETPETPQSDSVDSAAAKYQQILNEYAASQTKSEPETQVEPELQPQSLEAEPELPPLPPLPESESQYQTPISPVEPFQNNEFFEPESQTNLFKNLFIIVLFLNIIVFSIAGLVYYKTNQNKSNLTPDNSALQNQTPEVSNTCLLNDITYQVNESFPSDDGCNTCSCTETGDVVCTEKACDFSSADESAEEPTIAPTKAATKAVIPKITPDKVVLTFYQGYIKSSQGINAYKNNPSLTQSFQDKLTKDYSSSTGPGADAILLAQDKPKTFTSKIIKQDATTATVSLTESNGWSQTLTVNLVIVGDQWKIDSVSLNE